MDKPARKSVRVRVRARWIVLTGQFNSSSNKNYVGTKFSCLKYDLQCTNFEPDKTYNTTMYVWPAKTQVCASTHKIKQASCILYDQWRVWTECAVAVALFILLWTARLSMVNTISECSYQNVQARTDPSLRSSQILLHPVIIGGTYD